LPETISGVADYYELLEVARTATPEQIRAAITAQRRIWVRRQSSPDLERRAEAEQRVRDIDAAERTLLLNAERRREYDQQFQTTEEPVAATEPVWPPPEKTRSTRGLSAWDRVDDEESHLWMGQKHLDRGTWDLAIAEFEFVLERNDAGEYGRKAKRGLAAVASLSGRIEETLRTLEQAVAENPADEEAKHTLVTALYDSAIVVLSDGPFIETRRQWRVVGNRLRRIQRLGMKDPRTKLLVDRLRELRKGVRRSRWKGVTLPGVYVALVLVALIPTAMFQDRLGYLLSGLLLVPIAVVFVVRHVEWRVLKRRPTRYRGSGRSSPPTYPPPYPYDW
jgi:tetratricopeptide (TPR) repeat protein